MFRFGATGGGTILFTGTPGIAGIPGIAGTLGIAGIPGITATPGIGTGLIMIPGTGPITPGQS